MKIALTFFWTMLALAITTALWMPRLDAFLVSLEALK